VKTLILITALVLPLSAANYEDRETIHRTFHVAAGDNVSKLEVHNVSGFIHVTGGAGSEIQVTAEKRMRADTQADLDRAKKDVQLGATQDGNSVKLFYDGPSHSGDCCCNCRDGYNVTFDYEIQVPAGAQVDLHSVSGAIEVRKTSGDFQVHSVSGKVDMQEIGGAGSAQTVNAPVKVQFARNPVHPSNFHTVNGAIDVYFASNPDADINFHTVNGGVYSDFDVTLAPTTIKGGTGNRFVYRAGGNQKVRAGNGGPELSFHTVNGPIRLHNKAN
jgi:hypothetical protein